MIFNYVKVDQKEYHVEGQVRLVSEDEMNVSFNDLLLGNDLKKLYDNNNEFSHIVFKSDDMVKHETENVSIQNLTIDNNGYRVTFKEK